MSRCLLLILAAVWPLSGCAAHYQKSNGDQVALYLRAPAARTVLLVVTEDTLRSIPAVRTISGNWKNTLKRKRGFNYFYLVDGKPYVPDCVFKEKDDFGGYNCVYSP